MEFSAYISNMLAEWYFYLPLLLLFIAFYIFILKKYIWGIFDPLLVTAITMGSASYAVFTLWLNDWVNLKYPISFICTEFAIFIGFFLANNFFSNRIHSTFYPFFFTNNSFVSLFSFITGLLFSILQIYSFCIIGFVILREGVNHVSAYDGLGILKAFQSALSTIFFITFFYKKKISHLNFFDYLFFSIALFGILVSGSKSAILRPITIFFVIDYYFHKKTGQKIYRPNWLYIFSICIFPILVIMIIDQTGLTQALLLFGARLIGSGDIFVMGYNDEVFQHISAHSFFQYVLYPGWGSILKTIGFPITPPSIIGVDIYNYYYNLSNAGPNARLNFLAYYFYGIGGGSFLSFLCGWSIGYVRCIYVKIKHNYFNFFLYTILYLQILYLITDLNIFFNNFFWESISFILLYFITQIIYSSLTFKYA